MRNKVILNFMLLCLSTFGICQNVRVNWSILIDNEMDNLSGSVIIVEYDEGTLDTIQVNMIPGDIIIDSLEYVTLRDSGNIKQIFLKFRYSKVCKNSIKYYNYKIPIKKEWLYELSFFILYIYNIDNRKNKKIYYPLEGKEYNYNYRYPEGPSRIIQKKFTKKQKKCLN